MFRAVIFDFDGLIIDTESVWFESYQEVLSEYHVDFPFEIFEKCVGTHNTALSDYIENNIGEESVEKIKERARNLHQQKIVYVDIRDGVQDYLDEAQKLGLHIGLASSSNREWVVGFLNKLNLLHYFEVIKTSNDVEKIKPDPELYLAAIAALGVEPNEAIAFEDSVNGAKAAKAAGLTCVIVPNKMTKYLHFDNYDLRISSMADQSLLDIFHTLQI